MKRRFYLLTLVLIIASSIFTLANRAVFLDVNATYVEGPITQDTIWTLVDSPIIIAQDVTVYQSAKLTIEPGVEVKFGGAFSLIIFGRLNADGTSKPIAFTSNKIQPEAGDWNAIIFNGIEKSTLAGCFVAYARDGIFAENGNIDIVNTTISLSQNGITAINSKLRVFDSTMRSCYQNGINLINSEVLIQNSVISDNHGNGIYITGNGQITVQNNTVIANESGILLTGNETSGVSISENKISANKQSGVQVDAENNIDLTITNNIISSNDKGFYILSPTGTYLTNNSISYNKIGISYDKGSHAVNYNDVYENEVGMNALSNATVNAKHNYWGDQSGPYHESLNVNGKGNIVSGDQVDFIFFLTKPNGYINTLPTATLQIDKISAPQNEDVMFFATDSSDEGSVDRYFFDFGDGSHSDWTTLSIFAHKYASLGTYYASLMVMDDFGAVSNSVVETIYVQSFPSLQVTLALSASTVSEGEQVSTAVYVTDGTAAVENADVTVFSLKGGDFTQSHGFTDATGYFVTLFTAPDITPMTNVRIVARASKVGFTDGSQHKYVEVLPFMSVQITASPDTIKSEGTAEVLVQVKSNEEPVENATVTLLSSSGNLSLEIGTTDSRGTLSLVLTAPKTTTLLNITLTAAAMKAHYMEGVGQTIVAIQPKVLTAQITVETNVTISEAESNVFVHVEYETIPIAGANVTITAEKGNLSTTTGLTDTNGDITFVFSAPAVKEQTTISLTATVAKDGHAETRSLLQITVNPRAFDVQISTTPMKSGSSANILVRITCQEDGISVGGATVAISSDSGNFTVTTKTTDSTGTCMFAFNAPQTTAQLSVTVTANVTRDGYIDGGNQAVVIVTPKSIPQGEGGWPIAVMLLIIIAIVLAIVALMVKLKIIVLSVKEEQ